MVSLTLLVGAVVGFLVAVAMRSDVFAMGAGVVFGMIGAAIGHGIADALGMVREGSLAGWRLAFLGALAVPLLMRGIGLFRTPAPQRVRPR